MRIDHSILEEYVKNKKSFVWITYLEIPHPMHEIKPTFIDFSEFDWMSTTVHFNKVSMLLESYPNLEILESFIHEDLDYICDNYGLLKSYIWDSENQNYRSFMLFFKEGKFIKHSIGECFCMDTLIRNISELIPELFEPTSEG